MHIQSSVILIEGRESSDRAMSTSIDTCYFTCTLGQAQICGHKREIPLTVNDFLDEQNNQVPLLPSVAFPQPQESAIWTARVFSKWQPSFFWYNDRDNVDRVLDAVGLSVTIESILR